MNPLRWLWKQLAGPEDEAPPAPDELVTVATADGEGLAGLWQSTLEGQGIRCLLKSIGLIPIYGRTTFELQVQYKDLDRAPESCLASQIVEPTRSVITSDDLSSWHAFNCSALPGDRARLLEAFVAAPAGEHDLAAGPTDESSRAATRVLH